VLHYLLLAEYRGLAEAQSEETTCWACKQAIPLGARVCTECSSWQNWRKWVNISTVNLSLVIALISVLGAVTPTLMSLFERDHFSLKLIYTGSVGKPEQMQIYASNVGNKLAIHDSHMICIVLMPQDIIPETQDREQILIWEFV
jgi:hypothetical protein